MRRQRFNALRGKGLSTPVLHTGDSAQHALLIWIVMGAKTEAALWRTGTVHTVQ